MDHLLQNFTLFLVMTTKGPHFNDFSISCHYESVLILTVWSRCKVGPLGATSALVRRSGTERDSATGCALVSVRFSFEVELVAR